MTRTYAMAVAATGFLLSLAGAQAAPVSSSGALAKVITYPTIENVATCFRRPPSCRPGTYCRPQRYPCKSPNPGEKPRPGNPPKKTQRK